MLKKTLLGISILSISFLGLFATVNAQNGGFGDTSAVEGYTIPGTSTVNQSNGDELLNALKRAVNRVLGILSLITLLVILRGGFQMVTAAGDDGKHKKGFTILRQAAIGLAVIGFAWLFVSLIFWLINKFAGSGGGSASTNLNTI